MDPTIYDINDYIQPVSILQKYNNNSILNNTVNANVINKQKTLTGCPVVLLHGVNASASSLTNLEMLLKRVFPNLYVRPIEIGNGVSTSKYQSILAQAKEFALQILSDYYILRYGCFDVIAHSQSGIIMRVYMEEFNIVPIHNLITLSSPLNGFYQHSFRLLFPKKAKLFENIVDLFVYNRFVQRIGSTQYWHKPNSRHFLKKSRLLPVLNNMRNYNVQRKTNMLLLNHWVMIGSVEDGVIMPYQSSWFGYFKTNKELKRNKSIKDVLKTETINTVQTKLVESVIKQLNYENNIEKSNSIESITFLLTQECYLKNSINADKLLQKLEYNESKLLPLSNSINNKDNYSKSYIIDKEKSMYDEKSPCLLPIQNMKNKCCVLSPCSENEKKNIERIILNEKELEILNSLPDIKTFEYSYVPKSILGIEDNNKKFQPNPITQNFKINVAKKLIKQKYFKLNEIYSKPEKSNYFFFKKRQNECQTKWCEGCSEKQNGDYSIIDEFNFLCYERLHKIIFISTKKLNKLMGLIRKKKTKLGNKEKKLNTILEKINNSNSSKLNNTNNNNNNEIILSTSELNELDIKTNSSEEYDNETSRMLSLNDTTINENNSITDEELSRYNQKTYKKEKRKTKKNIKRLKRVNKRKKKLSNYYEEKIDKMNSKSEENLIRSDCDFIYPPNGCGFGKSEECQRIFKAKPMEIIPIVSYRFRSEELSSLFKKLKKAKIVISYTDEVTCEKRYTEEEITKMIEKLKFFTHSGSILANIKAPPIYVDKDFYYTNKNEFREVQPIEEQEIYKKDTFGLKTLVETGKVTQINSHLHHSDYLSSTEKAFIQKWLMQFVFPWVGTTVEFNGIDKE